MVFNRLLVRISLLLWIATQFSDDVTALHSSHLSPRFRRDTLDATVDNLKATARVTTAIYLTQELIGGTDKANEITAELLKMGSVTPSQLSGLDFGKLKSAITELNDLPTSLNMQKGLVPKFIKNMKAALVIKKNMVNITKINDWPEKASFKTKLEALRDDGIADPKLRQALDSLGSFKITFPKAKSKPDEMANLVQYSKALINDLPHLPSSVRFSDSRSAINDDFWRIDRILNSVLSLNEVTDADTSDAAVNSTLEALFTAAEKIGEILTDLKAMTDVINTRTLPGSLRQLVYTTGWVEGHADLAKVPNDVNSQWMRKIINSSSFEKSLAVLKQLNTPLTTCNGKFGSFDSQKIGTMTRLRTEFTNFGQTSSKRDEFKTTMDAVAASKTLSSIIPNDAVKARLKVIQLDDMFFNYSSSLQNGKQKIASDNLVAKLKAMVDEIEKPGNQGKTLSEIFTPLTNQADMADVLSDIYKSLDDDDFKKKARNVLSELTKIDSYLSKVDQHLNELQTISGLKDLDVVEEVFELIKSVDTATNPNRPDFSSAIPVVTAVEGASGALKSVVDAIGATKGVTSNESKELKLLAKPKEVSDHVGNAVRGVGEIKTAIDAIPKMETIMADAQLVQMMRLAAPSLSSESVTQLKALETLNGTLTPMIAELRGFETTVASQSLGKLADSAAIFTAAKAVSGTTVKLEPMLVALDSLVAVSTDPNSLKPIRSAVETLGRVNLNFASFHTHYDPVKHSITSLEKFFSTYAQKFAAADAAAADPRNNKGGRSGEAGGKNGKLGSASGNAEEKTWMIGGGVAVLVLLALLIFAGYRWRRAWNQKKKAEQRNEEKDKIIAKLNVEIAGFKDAQKKRMTNYMEEGRAECETAKLVLQKSRIQYTAVPAALFEHPSGDEMQLDKTQELTYRLFEWDMDRITDFVTCLFNLIRAFDDNKESKAMKANFDRDDGKSAARKKKLLYLYYTELFHNVIEQANRVDKSMDAQGTNVKKNKPLVRNSTILFEDTRVKVQGLENDFLHASWVRMDKSPVTLIAMQGPLGSVGEDKGKEDTCERTWMALVQCEVQQIVMLCNFEELKDNKLVRKCANYFPLQVNEEKTYGRTVIRCVGYETAPVPKKDIIVRRLHVKDMTSKTGRYLDHYQYTGWPDHSLPETNDSLIWLLGKVNDTIHTIAVHCSAGLGRTGVFAGVLHGAHRVNASKFNVLGMITELRMQRPGLIQTSQQLAYTTHVIIEYMLQGKPCPEKSKLKKLNDLFEKYRKNEKPESLEKIYGPDVPDTPAAAAAAHAEAAEPTPVRPRKKKWRRKVKEQTVEEDVTVEGNTPKQAGGKPKKSNDVTVEEP